MKLSGVIFELSGVLYLYRDSVTVFGVIYLYRDSVTVLAKIAAAVTLMDKTKRESIH